MSALEHVLLRSAWIPYADTFVKSRLTLTYPENVIFTAQVLKRVASSDVYRRFPHAQRATASEFQAVDWQKSIIVLDSDLNLILAPDAVRRLVRLDRRLAVREAASVVFGPFRLGAFLERFRRFQWVGLFLIWVTVAIWGVATRDRVRSVTYSSSPSAGPAKSDP